MNTIGRIYRLTSFGESHGAALGGVIDGMPSGVEVNGERIQRALDRRRPGQSAITTMRKEADKVEFLSGLLDGVTTGMPIGFVVKNTNHRSADYLQMQRWLRPSHADFTYSVKYGIRDYRGGGRSSARETVSRVVGGALAMEALRTLGVEIMGYVEQVGDFKLAGGYADYDLGRVDDNAVRCPDADLASKMEALIHEVSAAGDTIGGVVACVIKNCPIGVGEPVFGKLSARLAEAMLSINAAKGFDYGMGFAGVGKRGSEMADEFEVRDGKIHIKSNHSGGIQGGISNGEDIFFRVAFKPVATLMRDMPTVDINGNRGIIRKCGRHDACVLPRAVPIVEAMAAMTILDCILENRCARW